LVIYCQTTGVSAAHATHCATYCTPCRPLRRAFSGWIRTPPPTLFSFSCPIALPLTLVLPLPATHRVRCSYQLYNTIMSTLLVRGKELCDGDHVVSENSGQVAVQQIIDHYGHGQKLPRMMEVLRLFEKEIPATSCFRVRGSGFRSWINLKLGVDVYGLKYRV